MSLPDSLSDYASDVRIEGPNIFFRRNRAGQREPSWLGSQVKSGSLSPDPNGWSAIGVDSPIWAVPSSFALPC
jgi:hypothetical protein